MNAGPGVERLIARWLEEESPGRAPDRILVEAGMAIDGTRQRRLGVDWREPVTLSIRTLTAVAAVLVVAIAAAAWLGRSTATVAQPGASAAAIQTPGPSVSGATLVTYKAARDAICGPAIAQVIALNVAAESLKPDTNPADVGASATNLGEVISIASAATDSLAALEPPASMAADHAADVTHHRDSIAMLNEAVAKLRANDASGADAIADAVNALSAVEEEFERKYGLAGCP